MTRSESSGYDVIYQVLFVEYIMNDNDMRFLSSQFEPVRQIGEYQMLIIFQALKFHDNDHFHFTEIP